MGRNVVLADDIALEDGEIQDDDDDLNNIRSYRNASMEIMSENMMYISSNLDEEREREVDRIIREVQEAAERSEFTNLASTGHLVESVNSDDEDALRLAVLNTSKDRRFVQQSTSQETEEGEINNRSQRFSDMKSRIKSRKFQETALPLKVTVRNDNANSYSCWVLNNQKKAVVPTNVEIMETTMNQFPNPFEEQLHRLRLRVEANKFSKKTENLRDNYEQVGMDIVDSDRDSRSRSSPTSPSIDAVAFRPHEMQIRNDVVFDAADNEEDVDQLRAELLEQIMQRKNNKKLISLKSSLEEGELSSANSEDQSDHDSNEGPNSSYSGSDDGQVQDYRIKLPRKRKENFREVIPKKLRWKSKDEFGGISGIEWRKTEDWEHMVDAEKKILKEIERKLRHRDDQKSITRRKRDSFLERANRCAHQLGVLDAEMEVLRCDQEKAKGRLSYLEKQLEKAQCENNYKNTEKKTFEKKNKRMERLVGEAKSIKNINKDVGNVYDPIQIMVTPENDAKVLGMIKTPVLGHSELLNTTIMMNYSNDRDNFSRSASSSGGSQRSPINILRDSDIIQLSDSSDSMNGLVTAMRELEQEELEASFIAEAATTNSPIVCHENGQGEKRINRNVILSEKDVNELKNNPLIMFNGYRISPTFPYHLIAHRALSNKLDPLKPLCYYELLGRCADATCSMQHEEDYLLSDEELICSVLAYCPNLCPPKKMFSEYAREILKENEAKPVGELIEDMLKSLPENERRIRICEMATKYRLPSKLSAGNLLFPRNCSC
uniref:Zf-C3H1 domain-containing protein n=1 Tax=Onchocerca volvulus TaxID=6282 RepID=A0A8R1TJ71_ONCVO